MTYNTKNPFDKREFNYKKHQIVQAEPGYFAIDIAIHKDDGYGGKGFKLDLLPVVAWACTILENRLDEMVCKARPITHELLSSLFEGAVLYPGGRVVIAGENAFKDLEAYRAHVEKTTYRYNANTTISDKAIELHASGKLEAEKARLKALGFAEGTGQ